MDEKGNRKRILGITLCECKKHKCTKITRYEDRLCDDCYIGNHIGEKR